MNKEKRAKLANTERRFVPRQTSRSKLIVALFGVGGLLLGAGVYAQWLQGTTPSYALWLLAGGALLTVLAALLPDGDSAPLRVGPAGVAIERPGEPPDRMAWCDIAKVTNEGSAVVIHGADAMRFLAGLPHHAAAAAWIVAEALDRIPSRVNVSADFREKLPSAKEAEAQGVTVGFEPVQVAGRRCKASGKLISFEDDARLCPRCAEVYHRDYAGEDCLGCQGPMST